jgi:predicted PurR-regulated permease PerM
LSPLEKSPEPAADVPIVQVSLARQLRFWFFAVVVLGLLVWLFSEVLLPFVVGIALAYLQAPLADRLENVGVNRTVAALMIVGVVVLAFILLAVLIVPRLIDQLIALFNNMPAYLASVQAFLVDPSRPWLKRFIGSGDSTKTVLDLAAEGMGGLSAILHSAWTGGKALAAFASLLVVTPVVNFYMIVDWHRMLKIMDSWVPLHHRDTVHQIVHDIDTAIAGFLRGQLMICLILGTYYAIALSLVGLNYSILIGVIAGLITFVPYVGSMTGFIIAVSVAVAQFWPDYTWILAVVGIFVFGQFAEGNILAPKMVGENIGLHPVWVIFAMFAFGYLFGFVGLLIAVPLAAVIGVLFRFGMRQYLASAVYTGGKLG